LYARGAVRTPRSTQRLVFLVYLVSAWPSCILIGEPFTTAGTSDYFAQLVCINDRLILRLFGGSAQIKLNAQGEWVIPTTMKVIADERRRVTLPRPVRAGDAFELEEQGNGRLVLTKLVKPDRPSGKLVRRGGLLLLSSEGVITWEQTRKAMDEFP
jgi:hypothetical protein